MKKITIFFLLLAVSVATFSQQSNPTPQLTKQDYLQKSKHQKIAGAIFFLGGTALWLGGAGAYMNQKNDMGGTKGKPAMVIGGGSVLVGVPFLIASGRNKKKAMHLSFKNEMVPGIYKSSLVYNSIPSLILKFKL